MSKCWREEPQDRPQFAELVKTIEEMLGVELDYLDLDCLTGVSNRQYFMDGQESADAVCLTKPQLRWDEEDEDDVQEVILPVVLPPEEQQQQHGYLNMMAVGPAELDEKAPLVGQQQEASSSSVDYLMPIVRT